MFSVLAFSCGLIVALLSLVGFGFRCCFACLCVRHSGVCFDCGAVAYGLLMVLIELRFVCLWVVALILVMLIGWLIVLIIDASFLLVFYCDLVVMQLLVVELVAAGYFVCVVCGAMGCCDCLGLAVWLLV